MIQGLVAGYEAIEGRNRDRLASNMLAHNFSVGGLPIQYLAEDYKDEEQHRDCIYYRTQLRWKHAPLNLSMGVNAPWGKIATVDHICSQNQGFVVNKMCLSNFLSEPFLEALELIAKQFPYINSIFLLLVANQKALIKQLKRYGNFEKFNG